MKKLLLSVLSIISLSAVSQWQATSIFTTGEDCTTAFGKVLVADDASNALVTSTDDGASFSTATGVPASGLKFGVLNGTTLYAYKNNTIYSSTAGTSWTAMNTSAMATNDVVKGMAVVNGTVLAATNPVSGVSSKMYELSGSAWVLRSSMTGTLISTIKNLNGTLWAGTTSTLVLKSANGGITFTAGASSLNPPNWYDKYVFCLGSTPTAIFFGTYGGRVFKSTDNGATWATSYNVSNGSTFAISDMYTTTSNNLLVACDSGFVYTTNSGTSWSKSNAGFNYSALEYELGKVTANANYIFASTKNGKFFRRPIAQIFSGINENSLTSIESKVFPNPSNDKTTISADDLINESNCAVKLFNVLGQEITEVKMNNGKALIAVSDIAAGLYTYTIYNNKQVVGNGKLVVN